MACTVNSLIVGRIIGEVVDLFVPIVTMTVSFHGKHVNNGCNVKPSVATDEPKVEIFGHPSNLYTLLMIDPDAPSPSDPTMREWIHWLVVDIPGGGDLSNGRVVVPYERPQPQLGIHRFVFVLFEQKMPFPLVTDLDPPLNNRAGFNTRYFAASHDLGLPVASMFFNARREPMTKQEREEKKRKEDERKREDKLKKKNNNMQQQCS